MFYLVVAGDQCVIVRSWIDNFVCDEYRSSWDKVCLFLPISVCCVEGVLLC